MKPVDRILYAPASTLAAPIACGPRRRNPPRKSAPARKPTSYLDEEALTLYGGKEAFLVRTALIRSESYKKSHASAPIIGSSRDIVPLLAHLKCSDVEYMVVFAVDVRMRLLAIHEVAKGGISSAGAEMRDVVKVPLLTGATAVLLAHNHPSGEPSPSSDDVKFTVAVRGALKCIGVQLLDHVIIADRGSFSFADTGMMPTIRENPDMSWWA